MSTPLVVNRAPASGSVAGVADSARFSVRDLDTEIDRSLLQLYQGYGPVHWDGASGAPPDDVEGLSFEFRCFFPVFPNNPALREMVGDQLKLTKSGMTPREGVYFFGGLQAPANPDDPLMAEFQLELNAADCNPDGDDFTGVAFGLFAGAKGIAVKLIEDGGTRRIEIHSAESGTIAPPSGTYIASYDWDGLDSTYKILWHPQQDRLVLYLASAGDAPDTRLVDGAVSDFPDLPADEQYATPPYAFFGHLEAGAESISYWGKASLQNVVTTSIVNGVTSGGQEGFLITNEVFTDDCTELPVKSGRPWNPLPASFGSLGGITLVPPTGLVLRRDDWSKSLGYFRSEPKVVAGKTIFDITIRGQGLSLEEGSEATGMEFYIDDGVKTAKVAFLQDPAGTNYVGVLRDDTAPKLIVSYDAVIQSFQEPVTFRLSFEPGALTYVVLSALVPSEDGGTEELVLVSVPYVNLPVTALPGPGLGFLHNALDSQATAEMNISLLRYFLPVARFTPADVAVPPAGWTKQLLGAGSIVSVDGTIRFDDGDEASTSNARLRYLIGSVQSDNGIVMETRMWVESFVLDGESMPVRKNVNAGLILDDGTKRITMMLADAGALGKIVYFASDTDFAQNLLDIMNEVEAVDGTYAILDWSGPHLYRLERTVGAELRLFIDDSVKPLLEFPASESPGTPTIAAGLYFGNFRSTAGRTISVAEDMKAVVSNGFDVSLKPTMDDQELQARFSSVMNVIVEAEDI